MNVDKKKNNSEYSKDKNFTLFSYGELFSEDYNLVLMWVWGQNLYKLYSPKNVQVGNLIENSFGLIRSWIAFLLFFEKQLQLMPTKFQKMKCRHCSVKNHRTHRETALWIKAGENNWKQHQTFKLI